MDYTVSQLAKLSGVSARTLRYYDEISLLKPKRVKSNGYRIYGETEVDLLQQILFYRELDFPLEEIKNIVHAEDFVVEVALKNHLTHLNQQKNRLDGLINTVEQTIQGVKGEVKMTDQEKFEAFKKDNIRRNEEQYGEEIREKYGEDVINQSNKRFANMSEVEYKEIEKAVESLNKKLNEAVTTSTPGSELGQEVARLHQRWIQSAWPKGHYDKEKHYNLSLMYVNDPRFKKYYENIAPGAAEFLHEALKIYLGVEEE